MMYETLQRMKELLIDIYTYIYICIYIYIYLRQDHAKIHNFSENQIAPKALHKLPNYIYIPLFLPASTKLIINET